MGVDAFVKQLIALRAQAIATVAGIDAVLAKLEEDARREQSQMPSAAAPNSLPEGQVDPEKCDHPMQARQPAGTMGHPNQFFCMKCKTVQE